MNFLHPDNVATMNRGNTGFTLIELMIVVAIVGILSAIALPAYTQYVMSGRLTEATATLAGHRVKMEQFYQDNRNYTNACLAGTVATQAPTSENFSYPCTYTLAGQGYEINAVGVAGSAMAGFDLQIDQSGTRTTEAVPLAKGWVVPATNCWVRKKSGAC